MDQPRSVGRSTLMALGRSALETHRDTATTYILAMTRKCLHSQDRDLESHEKHPLFICDPFAKKPPKSRQNTPKRQPKPIRGPASKNTPYTGLLRSVAYGHSAITQLCDGSVLLNPCGAARKTLCVACPKACVWTGVRLRGIPALAACEQPYANRFFKCEKREIMWSLRSQLSNEGFFT